MAEDEGGGSEEISKMEGSAGGTTIEADQDKTLSVSGKSIKFKDAGEDDVPQKEMPINDDSNNNQEHDKGDNGESDDTSTESYEEYSSSENEDDEENSQFSYQDDEDGRPLPMPPLKYARIMGDLPRDGNSLTPSHPTLTTKITCSAMGRIIIRPSAFLNATISYDDTAMLSGSKHGDLGRSITLGAEYSINDGYANSEGEEYNDDEEADQATTKAFHVMAFGFQDGTVRLYDAMSGGSVHFGSSAEDPGAWFVNPSSSAARAKRGGSNSIIGNQEDEQNKIVALSFDSTSSYLCAVNADGDVAIFGPLVWGRQSRRAPLATASAGAGGGESSHKFTSFLSSFAGGSTTASIVEESQATNADTKKRKHRQWRPPFTLAKPPSSTVRFTYCDPQKLSSTEQPSHPTCMALDPSYGRRKERAIIVGFDDGRLVLSKLQIGGGVTAGIGSGFTSFFGGGGGAGGSSSGSASGSTVSAKKVDSVLYQGMGASSSAYSGDQNGIEVVTWRGGMVAWADSSGVRLFDIESMSRVAHIDRPTGARTNLYPTISALRPSLVFERSDSLLIAWGDCLMAMLIREVVVASSKSKDDSAPKPKRKTVECTMAWELDCVACGLTPIDGKHVAVLGLLPSPADTSQTLDGMEEKFATPNMSRENEFAGGDNVLELQVINRVDGKSISNDKLQLLEAIDTSRLKKINGIIAANALEFNLLSSFAIPRMDDSAESEEMDETERECVRRGLAPFDSDLPSESTKGIFLDFHLRWNMSRDVCYTGLTDDIESGHIVRMTSNEADDQSAPSTSSICSDDYVFALSAPINEILSSDQPPLASPSPTMVVLCSYDVCLVQTRDIDDLISYARSMQKPALALKYALAHRREVRRHALDQLVDEYFISLLRLGRNRPQRALSYARLKIAAQTMPILLGGDARMWQRWIFLFGRIPGGLFLIRDHIPVRDPALPAFIFEMALEKMLEESCNNILDENGSKNYHLAEKMAGLFLETLRAWGNTYALRRRIQLHRYCTQSQRWNMWLPTSTNQSAPLFIQQAEKDLNRRISQTAFGCLTGMQFSTSAMQNTSIRQSLDSSSDALFDIDHLAFRFSQRLHVPDTNDYDNDHLAPAVKIGALDPHLSVVVEALAELELMRERFDQALGYYLALGCHFASDSFSSLEESAVSTVNSVSLQPESSRHPEGSVIGKYDHVLSLIEIHQLYPILLTRNYNFVDSASDVQIEPPIASLIRLVGLNKAGNFLMESISPPEDTYIDDQNKEKVIYVGANLPLDLVARQLKPRPKLLYWFLYQVFTRKPEIYVKFPTTAVPPNSITDLHRIQFSLFVEFAEENGSGRNTDAASFTEVDRETPFMAFLKAALPHAGVQPENVRQMLESHRGSRIDSPVFARELAFVIEKFGRGTEEDAKETLDLYLRGLQNLYLAVSFAERSKKHTGILWDILVNYCTSPPAPDDAEQQINSGSLFGSLLEAAAHCGADLSSLVSKIPPGMAIEGLREKLISSVIDYRHKVKIHEQASKIQADDKVGVLRELSHLSRRGSRISVSPSRKLSNISTKLSTKSRLQNERTRLTNISAFTSDTFSLSIR